MKKKNYYYGLVNGQKLGYNIARKETYFFRIYSDGSACVMVRTKDGREYHFGDIMYCRTAALRGHWMDNSKEKNYIILKPFRLALGL